MKSGSTFFWPCRSLACLMLGVTLLINNTPCQFCSQTQAADRLPDTAPWDHSATSPEEIAEAMVLGIDRFLLRGTKNSIPLRARHWQRDLTSAENYQKSVESNRDRLKWILGLRDERVTYESPQLLDTFTKLSSIGLITQAQDPPPDPAQGSRNSHEMLLIRWPTVAGVNWEAVLLEPIEEGATRSLIVIPDAGETVAELLSPKHPRHSEILSLAQPGCRIVIMTAIPRTVHPRRNVELTDREFLYRTSFEMGRHPLGYEIQAVLGLVDWLKAAPKEEAAEPVPPVGIYGWGEGGLIALMSTAVDQRIDAACVGGYFGSRQNLWQEPIDRNLFGLLEQFGDAEIATLIAPRPLLIDTTPLPSQVIATKGGGPGRLQSPGFSEAKQEAERAEQLLAGKSFHWSLEVLPADTTDKPGVASQQKTQKKTQKILQFLQPSSSQVVSENIKPVHEIIVLDQPYLKECETKQQSRLVEQITARNQRLLAESPEVRKAFFADLKTNSLAEFERTIEPYRDYFRQQVIGEFERPLLEPRPRTRKIRETEKWTGYEVMLDVFPEVFAYGILLVPKEIPAGEKRPVVVCQHGLEGLPFDTIEGDHPAYDNFAAQLADRGFVVFAPQNPYRGKDLFRTLQRKANPLGKSLFSIIVPQHEQLTRWLGTLPEVDSQRIAFYGLSYGGKTAMRVPPLVKNYCLSICSADFNDWIAKNVDLSFPASYVWTGEYEIYEFDMGNTFNYAEMAALIAPRPFMVERGHFDGVGPDEWVASEFAKVQRIYKVQLGLHGTSEIEWFVGPHKINGQGTFRFLHKQLEFPEF